MTRPGHRPPSGETDGAVLFGRYAFPPNDLGYCGPDRAGELLERVGAGASGRALEEVARGFEGAWPYLELISECLGRAPLDPAVVEAYWLGGPELARCGGAAFAGSLETRFRPRLTRLEYERLAEAVARGATPHHSFHVFGVYPWVGLLRGGRVEEPLEVLDRCRIRWGRVADVEGDVALVETRRLAWDGRALSLGPPAAETARFRRDGHALARPFRRGDLVSLHWDWVCDRIGPTGLARLRTTTLAELRAVNACTYSAPATVLA
ncbi:DUF6390 family protein [Demequina pelophila]|uniref:DUF6390 family protein n=1 Tax=Demequina pelophila TaxID=1638984 RepID=UPI000783B334|nr:DUF6390 family protein [Demequina pelophila]